jgi:hypothetical protein
MMKRRCIGRGTVAKLLNMEHHPQRTSTVLLLSTPLLLGDGARKEAAGVEQYVLVRGD